MLDVNLNGVVSLEEAGAFFFQEMRVPDEAKREFNDVVNEIDRITSKDDTKLDQGLQLNDFANICVILANHWDDKRGQQRFIFSKFLASAVVMALFPLLMIFFTSLAPAENITGILGFRYNDDIGFARVAKLQVLAVVIWLGYQLAWATAIIDAILLAKPIADLGCNACFLEIYGSFLHYGVLILVTGVFLALTPPSQGKALPLPTILTCLKYTTTTPSSYFASKAMKKAAKMASICGPE
jgi:hypothetical protein